MPRHIFPTISSGVDPAYPTVAQTDYASSAQSRRGRQQPARAVLYRACNGVCPRFVRHYTTLSVSPELTPAFSVPTVTIN